MATSTVPAVPYPATATRASGSSSSGVGGTLIAEITANPGQVFLGWRVVVHCTALTSAARTIVTFTDDTTEQRDHGPASAAAAFIGPDGFLSTLGLNQGVFAAKAVKKVRVETVGAGTAARTAMLHGWEVPA